MEFQTQQASIAENHINLYFPKVHNSVQDTVSQILTHAGIGQIVSIEFVPRLDNTDGGCFMMAFATLKPFDTPVFTQFYNEIKSGGLGKIWYYANYNEPRYLLATINHSPNKKQEKQEKGTCVMDIIAQLTKRIEELENKVSLLTQSASILVGSPQSLSK